jgi:hypothetical protein
MHATISKGYTMKMKLSALAATFVALFGTAAAAATNAATICCCPFCR